MSPVGLNNEDESTDTKSQRGVEMGEDLVVIDIGDEVGVRRLRQRE